MEQAKIKEKMRELLHRLMANPSRINRSKVLHEMVSIVNDSFNNNACTTMFTFDEWQGLYKAESECLNLNYNITANWSINKFIEDALDQSLLTDAVYKQFGTQGCILIPFHPMNKPNGLIVTVFDHEKNDIKTAVLYLMKKEIEQLLNVLNHYTNLKAKYEKKDFLFRLSASFYTCENKNDILKQIIISISDVYPDFSYYLLLSHDHEMGETLPIRTLEYNQETTKQASYIAFIGGELQIEYNENSTYVFAPLVGKQGVYGVLEITAPTKVIYPKEEIEFIKQFTNVAGKAIENTILYQNSKQHISDLKMINETTHQLNSNLHQEDILQIIKGKIKLTCHASEVGFILMKENSTDKIDILPGSTGYFYTQEGVSLSTYLLTESIKNQESIITGNLKNRIISDFHSGMIIPMNDGKEFLGAVVMLHEKESFFTFDRFKLLQSLIQHLTLALINSLLRERLEETVRTDYLTNLYSRIYLDEKINFHMKTDTEGILILFDIDDFKRINDLYGHYIGDTVIIQVADIIRQHITPYDIGARWGGEELAIYMPGSTIEEGYWLAEKIAQQVERKTDPLVTLSAGVSSWTNEKTDSVKSLFIRADHALYEAKRKGKNQVITK
ncbi:diguanylate cyclase [Virgibacillus sp. MSJ-26]|uniref:sensor domain-containing diguanylate cyclase n=1 Tax=Virgibacillus sp. MSJ-26 TaxID=2841522 RepID=UPI001C0FBC27|nr:diguanylate cyclase [Virgibacillus sp. MSJ-26]MBU5468128.1 diguanylate cyclase [Virgibacillus sp. MSJ-26]